MKSSLHIKIVIPLIPVSKLEQHLENYVQDAIDELLGLDKKLDVEILDLGIFNPSIYLIENYKPISGKYAFKANAIVFQIIVPNNYRELKEETNSTEEVSDEDKMSLFESFVSEEFRLKIFYFLILSQIAKPGSIKAREGDVYINDKLEHYFYSLTSIHRESLNDIRNLKWPTYKNIKFVEVWDWFQKNNSSFQRHSKSKTERALNAFSYLFKDSLEDIVFDLFWSLVGIEALYCSGKEGLSEQIFNKTQVFLGEIKDYKKRLKQMYDFRSRLVHGDLDIPPNHYELEDGDSEQFQQSLYDSTILAVAILTATLQKMVVENRKDLSFKYILE